MTLAAAITFLLLVLLGVLALNAVFVPDLRRDPRRGGGRAEGADVSVLIPARNEGTRIGRAVSSAAGQRGGVAEVIVADDDSEDDTAAVVLAQSRADPRIKMVRTGGVPAGWIGKAHACHRLRAAARARYLLFMDADVRLGPDAVCGALALMREKRLDLLSVFPEQYCPTLAEQLSVPFMDLSVYLTLPAPLVTHVRRASVIAATGQFLLVSAEAYDRAGGHEAVKGAVLEDMALARRVKAAGGRAGIASGRGVVGCRMYRSHREVLEGFGKNLYAASGFRPLRFAAAIAAADLLLFFPLLAAPFERAYVAPAVLVLSVRALHAARFRYPVARSVVLHPAAIVYSTYVALNSLRLGITGRARWKGRPLPRGAAR